MEKKLESSETKVSETKTVIQEFGEKISQALEAEKKKMKAQTEEEAKKIIDRAKKEANEYINQARRESEAEADRFYEEIKEKAEQILKDSREKAIVEARRETTRIIGEIREKTTQIIAEVIENGLTQVKNELSSTVSDTKNKLESETSQLLTITKNLELIIDETRTNIQTGIDHLAGISTDTGDKLQSLSAEYSRESVNHEQQTAREAVEDKPVETPEDREAVMDLPQEIEEVIVVERIEKSEAEQATVGPSSTTAEPIEEESSTETAEVEKPEVYSDVDKLLQEGTALLDVERTQEALVVLKKVTELDPGNALGWRKLGTALGMLERYTEALKALRRATTLTPKDITAWHNTEIILKKLGYKKEAKAAKDMEKQLIKQYPEQYKEAVKKSK